MPRFALTRRRRFVTVPGVALLALGLTVSAPVWILVSLIVDLVRTRFRLPLLRLLTFAWWWSWMETIGVLISGGLWIAGQSARRNAHYRLQGWWAGRLVAGLRVLCGMRIDVEGIEALTDGPLIICGRHASLADSLLPAWMLAETGSMRPRYVMKRELLLDPCLDIVGNRVPNWFVDRGATDTAPELDGIERLAADMGPHDAAVIYPEGGVASTARRWRALAKLVERDPARYSRLAALAHLGPPRAKGTMALLRGAPDADVVLMAHVGLEGLGRLGDAPKQIPLLAPVRVRLWRFPRAELPPESELPGWLDDRWLELDAWVAGETRRRSEPSPRGVRVHRAVGERADVEPAETAGVP